MAGQLTSAMRKALRDLVRGKGAAVLQNTLASLQTRELVDDARTLTGAGWTLALTLLPLAEQCRQLGITLEVRDDIVLEARPEIAAWSHFCDRGYTGAYCEGGPVLLLVRAAALDILERLNPFGSREDACTRFTEAQLQIHQDHAERILDEIRTEDTSHVIRAFAEIYSKTCVQEHYPGLTVKAMTSLLKALGTERLARLASAMFEDPYAYRSGWPDLTLSRGMDMLWAEVKTTDRLHASQIRTIHRMKSLLPGSLRVIQVLESDGVTAG